MANSDHKPFAGSHRAMATVFEVLIYSGRDEFFLRSVTESIFAELDRYERAMSLFVDGSDVDTINESAGKRPVRVSAEVFELIKLSVHYSGLTGGYFDITVGPLMSLWGFYRKRDSAPSEREIEEVLGKIGYRNIVLDEEAGSVFLGKEGMSVDLGGIAKGWSLRRMAGTLKRFGIEDFVISAGTSSVCASGSPGEGEYWTAELPAIAGERVWDSEIVLKDSSVSVSGSYEHFVRFGERRYSHIIDPLTGRPASGIVLAAVMNSDPLDCEILSTAFSAMGVGKTGGFLKRNAPEMKFNVLLVYYSDGGSLSKATFNYKS